MECLDSEPDSGPNTQDKRLFLYPHQCPSSRNVGNLLCFFEDVKRRFPFPLLFLCLSTKSFVGNQ